MNDFLRNLPIGLFDSGVGGLTVLQALRRRMPGEDLLYLGDTARLPYGTKSAETITRYALQASRKLVDRRIKALVVACNTATSVALPALQAAFSTIPVIGVVEPGAQAACAASRSGHIAVIATASTTREGAYVRAILSRRPEARVLGIATQMLVSMAEEGWFDGLVAEGVIARYLDPVFSAPDAPDCLVLGCTHFPLLFKPLRAVVGPAVTLVDSAATTAEAVETRLLADDLARETPSGDITFLTTDDVSRFAATGSLFLGLPITAADVQLVDL